MSLADLANHDWLLVAIRQAAPAVRALLAYHLSRRAIQVAEGQAPASIEGKVLRHERRSPARPVPITTRGHMTMHVAPAALYEELHFEFGPTTRWPATLHVAAGQILVLQSAVGLELCTKYLGCVATAFERHRRSPLRHTSLFSDYVTLELMDNGLADEEDPSKSLAACWATAMSLQIGLTEDQYERLAQCVQRAWRQVTSPAA